MTKKETKEQEKKLNNLLKLAEELKNKKELNKEETRYLNMTLFLYSAWRLNALQVVARLTLILTKHQINFDDIIKALED